MSGAFPSRSSRSTARPTESRLCSLLTLTTRALANEMDSWEGGELEEEEEPTQNSPCMLLVCMITSCVRGGPSEWLRSCSKSLARFLSCLCTFMCPPRACALRNSRPQNLHGKDREGPVCPLALTCNAKRFIPGASSASPLPAAILLLGDCAPATATTGVLKHARHRSTRFHTAEAFVQVRRAPTHELGDTAEASEKCSCLT